jgi:Domain of unknown function (DUF4232)
MAARLLVLALVIVVAWSARADASPTQATACTSVRWSTFGGNGVSGGVIVWALDLSNVGRRTCTVQGRPTIEVPPSRFPVEIADLQPMRSDQPMSADWAGADSPITLRPGEAALVDVIIDGCADRAKSNTSTVIARVGWASRTLSIWGTACRVTGTRIEVGTLRTRP